MFKCTHVLELKFSKGIFWGAYFLYTMGEICISVLALEETLYQHYFFFYCQVIVYVVDHTLVEEKVGGGGGGRAYFAELILPQPQPFSNPIDWMCQPLHFCSWQRLPIVKRYTLLSWFCIFLEGHNILTECLQTERRGHNWGSWHHWNSWGMILQLLILLRPSWGSGGVCMSLIWISNWLFHVLRSRPYPCQNLTHLYVVCCHFIYSFVTVLRPLLP